VPRKAKAIVLDSWAVIAFLEGEAAAEKVADHIADAHEKEFLCSSVSLMQASFGTSSPAKHQWEMRIAASLN
jgi:uncharacterized protein with PIN domain